MTIFACQYSVDRYRNFSSVSAIHLVKERTESSRASAAALSTVLRTTTLSYGNMPFSGTCPAQTSQPIKMKFCMTDHVAETKQSAKNDWNRLAGGGPIDR
jgi:hypothetical protein